MVGIQPVGIGSVDDGGAVVIGELVEDVEAAVEESLEEVEVMMDEERGKDSCDEDGVVVGTLLATLDEAV
jgi:sulfate adenylyltransferase subunit 1 (EFTu-like GTPase family)